MRANRLLLIGIGLGLTFSPASAGIFFHKRAKTNPPEQVPVLIGALKTETDDNKRSAAAQELREFDSTVNPEIVPALVDAALHDAKPGVRLDALQSLEKLRPISQPAGMALEQAVEQDASFRVRLQARSLLVQYRLAGYHGATKEAAGPVTPAGPKTGEPPLAFPLNETPTPSSASGASPSPATRATTNPTAPLLVPVKPPQLAVPPTAPKDEGPSLEPPK